MSLSEKIPKLFEGGGVRAFAKQYVDSDGVLVYEVTVIKNEKPFNLVISFEKNDISISTGGASWAMGLISDIVELVKDDREASETFSVKNIAEFNKGLADFYDRHTKDKEELTETFKYHRPYVTTEVVHKYLGFLEHFESVLPQEDIDFVKKFSTFFGTHPIVPLVLLGDLVQGVKKDINRFIIRTRHDKVKKIVDVKFNDDKSELDVKTDVYSQNEAYYDEHILRFIDSLEVKQEK